MQPTESQDVHEPEAQAPTDASPEATDNSDKPSPSWWQRLTSKLSPHEEPEPSSEEPQPVAEPEQRTLTDAEVQRLVQSEVDRREAARNKAARDAERKRLRDEDPWAFAEQERQQEQAQTQDNQLTELLQSIGRVHDEVTLVPLMNALEPAERERLMKLPGAGLGADGRKLLTEETLKALEKHWRAQGAKDAEAKLRRNPAFRKQVFAENHEDAIEPELLPSGSTGNGRRSHDINAMLRSQVGLPTRET